MTSDYKLKSLLGSGGFSNVYLAEHRESGEFVAIKILNNADGDARFAREAAVLQALESPYTVRLLEFGRSTSGPFMVFEYVEGAQELDAFLDAHGPIDWHPAVGLLRMMLMSLAEAHTMGVVHRDVKPANMLITPHGTIKVLDFGLVRLEPEYYDVTPLTQTGKVLGTPRYMAPEVLRASESAGPRADVFAIGMIAYHLLIGEPANTGRSAYEVIARHLDQDPYELPEHADVPYAIRAWIDAMLRKDSRRRTQDATMALAELDRYMGETALSGFPALTFEPRSATRLDDSRARQIGGFELTTELGRGGTAAVWQVSHRNLGGTAAMKLMLAGVSQHARAAFLAESRAHAGLSHPNIIRLLDFGHVEDEDVPPDESVVGDPYLVMELAEGTLRENGLPATWAEVLEICEQVLDALAFAHARGVIHRDLKPENVLVVGGEYKVSDFGIAHSLREQHRGSAETLAESIGTPRYMSPEQFRGHAHDFGPATDLYAFGCMAYELVCGHVPFRSARLVQIAHQHQTEPVPPLQPRFEVPPGFDRWVARLLAKNPHDRFAAAADAKWQLRQLAGGFISDDEAETGDFRAPMAPTVVSPLSERPAPGDVLTVLDEPQWSEPSEPQYTPHGEIPLGPNSPPPMPATWREQHPDQSGQSEGLGLFSLRELPLAGHEDARDLLWHALLHAQSERELVPIVLEGGPSAPVSQLGGWFAARAVEVGAAQAMFVSHTVTGAPREGLAGLLEDLFGTWSMDDEPAAALVRRRMRSIDDTDLGLADAEVLAQELLRARGVSTGASSNELERFSALTRLIRRRGRQRPVVLFLDHMQYSSESAAYVRYLVDNVHDLAAVVVVGKRGEAPRASLQRDLDALAADPRCIRIPVEMYEPAEYAEFVSLLLPLSAALTTRLSESSRRDPVFTRLTLADLIDRDMLEQREGVFELRRDTLAGELSPAAVIDRRVDRMGLTRAAREALTVCAILSEAPDPSEVTAVCERLDIILPPDLGAALADVGLAHSFGAGWWFTPGVRAHLIARVPLAERQGMLRACGAVVVDRLAVDDAHAWSRAAEYFVEAGASVEALEPLYRAVRLLVSRDLETAEALATKRGNLLDSLGLAPESTARIDQLNLLSVIAKSHGDRTQAIEHIAEAHDLAVAEGYARGLARALRDSAAVAVDLGSLGEAAARFDRAARISAEAGDALDEAHAWFGAGFVEYRRADIPAAERYYRAAIERFEQVGAVQAHARAMSYLSAAYVSAGRFEEARVEATRAQDLARSCGALAIVAETKSDLAEIARFCGDYQLARRLYEENAHWQQVAGSRSVEAITRLNLALVDLGSGRYQEAAAALAALEADVRDLGLAARLPLIRVAGLVAAVGCGGDANKVLETSGELFAVAEPDRDIAWTYECGIHAANTEQDRALFRKHADAEYARLNATATARGGG